MRTTASDAGSSETPPETTGETAREIADGTPAETPAGSRARGRTTRRLSAGLRRAAPPAGVLLAGLVPWQGFVTVTHQRPDLFPGPFEVGRRILAMSRSGLLWQAVGTSVGRGVLGFLVSVVLATLLGLLLAWSPWLRAGLGPLLSGLQVLPSVAWVPAAIVWFGLTDATVYTVILLGAVPSVAMGLVAGIDGVDPQHRRVAAVLGAGPLTVLTRVLWPAALPVYLGGLRQGWAFSWRALMAAEIIAVGGSLGIGLGGLLDRGRQNADMATVFAAILAILVIGVLVELLVFAPLHRAVLRRRGLS